MRVGQARKRDANETAIVQALRAIGAKVRHISAPGMPDLLVLYRGAISLLEVKGATGSATLAQEQLSAEGWPVVVVRTPPATMTARLVPVSAGRRLKPDWMRSNSARMAEEAAKAPVLGVPDGV